MGSLFSLVKRNIKLYFSDRTAVFLSLLGAIISILLVLVFLKTSIANSIMAGLGTQITATQADHLMYAWLVPSACVISSSTTGLGALRQFVSDRETARWRDLLVTPLPRWTITAGYLLAATIVSWLMTTIVYLLGTAYCLGMDVPLATGDVCKAWGWLMLCSLSFTALMGFLVSLIRTDGAFAGLSILVGVLFGFLNGTYVMFSSMPASFAKVMDCLPFAQASALVRQPYTATMLASLPSPVQSPTATQMGITINNAAWTVTTGTTVVMLVAVMVIGAVLAWQIIAHTVKR